mmetsp:Transcript_62974/g.162126  ORF Transcript_62974/g.162126 Transcript_62974/m.162126 type:complete len:249 (-) Transcript_62974:107-853(-)
MSAPSSRELQEGPLRVVEVGPEAGPQAPQLVRGCPCARGQGQGERLPFEHRVDEARDEDIACARAVPDLARERPHVARERQVVVVAALADRQRQPLQGVGAQPVGLRLARHEHRSLLAARDHDEARARAAVQDGGETPWNTGLPRPEAGKPRVAEDHIAQLQQLLEAWSRPFRVHGDDHVGPGPHGLCDRHRRLRMPAVHVQQLRLALVAEEAGHHSHRLVCGHVPGHGRVDAGARDGLLVHKDAGES